ncbi:MAG: DUF2336 domain-containing protein [Bradyrhizobium sp.]
MAALAPAELLAAVEAAVRDGPPERRARMLQQVAELFASDAARLNQAQIRLFDDILVRLIDRVEARPLTSLSAILAGSVSVPEETVRRLACHEDAAVAAPLLLKSPSISGAELLQIAGNRGQRHLLAISERTVLSEELTDAILRRAGKDVLQALAKNAGACFSEKGYSILLAIAERDDRIAESLGLRPDLPAAKLDALLAKATETVRARLLKAAPAPLRKKIQTAVDSRFAQNQPQTTAPIDYSDVLVMVDGLNRIGKLNDSTVNRFAIRREYPSVIAALSVLSGARIDVVEQLMVEDGCDGLIIACRASRLNWQTTLSVINNRSVPQISGEQIELRKELFETLYVSAAQYTMRYEPPTRGANLEVIDNDLAPAKAGR